MSVLSAGRPLSVREYSDFTAAASLVYFVAIATAPVWQTSRSFTATAKRDHRPIAGTIRHFERLIASVRVLVVVALAGFIVPLASAAAFWPAQLSRRDRLVGCGGVDCLGQAWLSAGRDGVRHRLVSITIEGIVRLVGFRSLLAHSGRGAGIATHAVASLTAHDALVASGRVEQRLATLSDELLVGMKWK